MAWVRVSALAGLVRGDHWPGLVRGDHWPGFSVSTIAGVLGDSVAWECWL